MTTESVIAEIHRTVTITGPNGGEAEGEQDFPVYLDECPLVEALLDAAKESAQHIGECQGTGLFGCHPKCVYCFAVASVQAIDSEWTP